MINSDYSSKLYSQSSLNTIVDCVWEELDSSGIEDYAIVCTGLSGIIPASALLVKKGIPFCVIRKSKSTHSNLLIEGAT